MPSTGLPTSVGQIGNLSLLQPGGFFGVPKSIHCRRLPEGTIVQHMLLAPKTRLGSYEILAPIGRGGMGEVYRAHDSRLNRDVAIKVSNAHFTERFTREARAIAALNHTNICHLYDVGPDYLVMEYVEGQNLQGPMDFDDALPLIQQLIDGIEAAHENNIVPSGPEAGQHQGHAGRCREDFGLRAGESHGASGRK